MDINDYFRFYREDTRTFDYEYRTVLETKRVNAELEKQQKLLESIRLENKISNKQKKLEKFKLKLFHRIQELNNGKAKHLVAFPPNNGTEIFFREYINCYKDWLEITITFMPLFRTLLKDIEIKNLLHHEMTPFMEELEIILIPEYNKSNHLHYHGYIRGKPHIVNDLVKLIKAGFGRTELKQIKYFTSYLNYVFKDTRKSNITYTDFVISNI